ncbi:MAG: FAD/NAD(P)-binding protein [Thiohalomonadaceae bacterium]
MNDLRQPHEAEIIERVQETPSIYTLRLRFTDPAVHAAYRFAPGQFNMLYLYGVGEVPISIVSDPEDEHIVDHTIRAVGRVTDAMARLQVGERLGVRGPYGRGWPVEQAKGRDVVIVTGGLGCAPVVSVINYVLKRRDRYGKLTIMQGVKHADDLIWREQYEAWSQLPNTQVLLSASEGGPLWPWHVGHVPMLFDKAALDVANSTVMMCGPEGMMIAAGKGLLEQGIPAEDIYLSMERNMQCAVGKCGHCQMGGQFVCKDGPVFSWPEIVARLGIKGV